MRYIGAIICLFFFACNNDASSKRGFTETLLDNRNSVGRLFPSGTYNATVITTPEATLQQKKTIAKFLKALNSNEMLAERLMNLNDETIISKELAKIGFTKNELATLSSLFEVTDTIRRQQQVSVSTSEEYVTFTGTGLLKILDSLTINLSDSSATFKTTELTYYSSDSSYMTNDFLPNGDYLEPVFALSRQRKGIAGLLALGEKYTLIIGKLNKSGKTYLYLGMPKDMYIDGRYNTFYSIILD